MSDLKEALGEDFPDQNVASKFDSVRSLAEAYGNLERKMGGAIIPPADDAPAEAWGRYKERLGVPASAADYSLEVKDDGVRGLMDKLRDVAYKRNVPAEAFKEMAAQAELVQQEHAQSITKQQEQARAEATKQLQEFWGKDYEDRVAKSDRFLEAAFQEDAEGLSALKEQGVLDNPNIMKALGKLAEFHGDDTLPGDLGIMNSGGIGDDINKAKELAREIHQLVASEEYLHGNELTPAKRQAHAKAARLEKQLIDAGYPGGSMDEKLYDPYNPHD